MTVKTGTVCVLNMNRQGSLRMETEMEMPVEMPANTRSGADKESAVVL